MGFQSPMAQKAKNIHLLQGPLPEAPLAVSKHLSCCILSLTLARQPGLSGEGFHKDLSGPWVAAGSPGGQHYNTLLPATKGSPGTGKRCWWPRCFPKRLSQVDPRNALSLEQGNRKAALGEDDGHLSL